MAGNRSRSRTSCTDSAPRIRRGASLRELCRGPGELPDDAALENQLTPQLWQWLQLGKENGAELTYGSGAQLAGDALAREMPRGSQRWCWWPHGLPPRPWSSVVSSRLFGPVDRHDAWLASFRAACREIEQRGEVLLTAPKTTGQRLLEHAARKLQIPLLRVVLPGPNESVMSWWRRLPERAAKTSVSGTWAAFLSPPWQSHSFPPTDDELENYPQADRTLLAWSDVLFVLHLRCGGNLHHLLPRRLREHSRHGRVWLALGPEHVPVTLAEPLLQLGAEPWEWQQVEPGRELFARQRCANVPCGVAASSEVDTQVPPAVTVLPSGTYLTHCTHAPRGRWPDQTEADYLDELWEGKELDKRTCLGALRRIVQQRRITASSSALRGGVRAVCFTARPLDELPQLRAFQPQRQCWRFEPYGLCLRREWLIDRGARAVIYGEAMLWQSLSPADRPFFQRAATRRGGDWTVEQEWRHLGDVELAEASRSDLFLFVPTEQEARELAVESPWPVVVSPPERG